MKNLTSLERSKLQLTMFSRLQDVFDDVKNEVDVTPEFIQDTLEQYMRIATGDNYYLSRSVRLGEGELRQAAEPVINIGLSQQLADELKQAVKASRSLTSMKNCFLYKPSNSGTANKIIEGEKDGISYQVKSLSVYEKFELMSDILMAIKNNRGQADYRTILAEDLQSIFESIHSLSKKDLRITGIKTDAGNISKTQ
ncbi:hypothetical protein [Xenorhabdus sp. Sc-CR9]|uniref:hypothetical protein n=1 Tax=Xenorhabdus sp. Sc-CR9 TaxID=2584468 RepID=UPI001F3DDA0C|nr:hypothetical protein [Xenorhabdus sp. Sc-CR9]